VLSVGWEWVKTSDLVVIKIINTDFLHLLTTDGEFPSIWGVGIPFKSKYYIFSTPEVEENKAISLVIELEEVEEEN